MTASNRKHFDRWIILTVPDDRATIDLCSELGLACVISEQLLPAGEDFHPLHMKAEAINEAIEKLHPEGWAAIFDPGILLPQCFGERIRNYPLQAGEAYVVRTRLACRGRRMRDALLRCEPWDQFRNLQRTTGTNCIVFSLEASPSRYGGAISDGADDDCRFLAGFGERVRDLPMQVLDVVDGGWELCTERPPLDAGEDLQEGLGTPRQIPDLPAGSALQVGFYPGTRFLGWKHSFEHIYLVDTYDLWQPSANALEEADRALLRRKLDMECAGAPGCEVLPRGAAKSLAQIPDGSIALLYVAGVVGVDLYHRVRRWAPKLVEGAVVCGDIYGQPFVQETEFVTRVFGIPDGIHESGFWWKRIDKTSRWLTPGAGDSITTKTSAGGTCGVAIVNVKRSVGEGGLIVPHAVRQWWNGPLIIYHGGRSIGEPLAMYSCKYQVPIVCVPEGTPLHATGDFFSRAGLPLPFEKTLLIGSDCIPRKELGGLFDRAPYGWDGFAEPSGAALIAPGMDQVEQYVIATESAAQKLPPIEEGASLVRFDGEPDAWEEGAYALWCSAEAAAALELAAPIRVRKNAAVIIFVDRNSAGNFERRWLSWKFGPDVEVMVMLLGVTQAEIWLGEMAPRHIVELSADMMLDWDRIVESILAHVRTEYVIFLPVEAVASSGAELFLGGRELPCDAVFHMPPSLGTSSIDETAMALSLPFFALLRTSVLERISKSGLVVPDTSQIPHCLARGLLTKRVKCRTLNVKRWGWAFKESVVFVDIEIDEEQGIANLTLDASFATGRLSSIQP